MHIRFFVLNILLYSFIFHFDLFVWVGFLRFLSFHFVLFSFLCFRARSRTEIALNTRKKFTRVLTTKKNQMYICFKYCLFVSCLLVVVVYVWMFFAVFSFAFFCYVLCKTAGIRILSVFFHFSLFLCVNIKICQLLACLLSNIRINKVILEINMYMYIYALQ